MIQLQSYTVSLKSVGPKMGFCLWWASMCPLLLNIFPSSFSPNFMPTSTCFVARRFDSLETRYTIGCARDTHHARIAARIRWIRRSPCLLNVRFLLREVLVAKKDCRNKEKRRCHKSNRDGMKQKLAGKKNVVPPKTTLQFSIRWFQLTSCFGMIVSVGKVHFRWRR